MEVAPGLVLRHAGAQAAIDGNDVPAVLGDFAAADAATCADGIVVLAERIAEVAPPLAAHLASKTRRGAPLWSRRAGRPFRSRSTESPRAATIGPSSEAAR